MRDSIVYISRVQADGLPFKGKIIFNLQSSDPNFISTLPPITAIFHNGKAKVHLSPNSAISPTMDTYYYWTIFEQSFEDSSNQVRWELVDEGYCKVPVIPHNCLQNILIEPPLVPSGSNCQCEEHQPCVVTGWIDWDSYEPIQHVE